MSETGVPTSCRRAWRICGERLARETAAAAEAAARDGERRHFERALAELERERVRATPVGGGDGAMNEHPLRDPDGIIRAWACGECGRAALNQTFAGPDGARAFAAQCCDRRCEACGERIDPQTWGYTCCPPCKRRLDREAERKLWEKAERVPLKEYDDRFVCNEDDPTNLYEADDIPWDGNWTEGINWAWAMKPEHATLDADHVAEMYVGDHYEGAFDHVNVADLQRRLDEWVAANPIVSYFRDTSRIVVAEPEDDDQ